MNDLAKYFCWVVNNVYNREVSHEYDALMKYIFQKKYEYDNWYDENRKSDGLSMRRDWFRENEGFDISERDKKFRDTAPCSWLEMFVAFAMRIESLKADPDVGDRTPQWFWLMMTSLGLSKMTNAKFNPKEANKILHTLAYHEFNEDGSGGGLFVIHDPTKNMKTSDLWYQMQYYLSEINPDFN